MIQVNPIHLHQIRTHAENTYPEECCGLLLGQIDTDSKILIEVRETENHWGVAATEFLPDIKSATRKPLTKRNRFSIAPQVMLQVQKESRDRNLVIIGIYHSHPDHQSIPSEFDRAIAHAQYSYIIVSVHQGRSHDLRSWVLDDGRQFQSEVIVTTS
ncbi:MAG: Mov34/MPN/PAD-1 family protein [Microcystaceae cyanobacterium]